MPCVLGAGVSSPERVVDEDVCRPVGQDRQLWAAAGRVCREHVTLTVEAGAGEILLRSPRRCFYKTCMHKVTQPVFYVYLVQAK